MADGYSRAAGEIPVVVPVSGPGVMNAATGLGEATTDTSAVLVIAFTVLSAEIGLNKGGLHDLGNTIDCVRSLCRRAERCMTVEEIPGIISDLCHELRYRLL